MKGDGPTLASPGMLLRVSRLPLLLTALSCALHLGCWASNARFEEFGPDGCVRPSGIVSPLTVRVSPGRCVLEGRDELGVAWRSVCDGASCALTREDEPVCSCTDLDFASTCNGIPTCQHWAYFDFTNVETVSEP